MYIETDRMVVRNYDMNDLNDLQDILGDEETMRYCETAYTLEKTAEFLREFCIGRKGAVAAVHKATNKMIGYILFNKFEADVYEMGWFFHKSYWRNGYAFESCNAVMNYAFDKLNAHKIFAETIDGERSVGMMQKLGMKLEEVQKNQVKDPQGKWADMYVYSVSQGSYKNRILPEVSDENY